MRIVLPVSIIILTSLILSYAAVVEHHNISVEGCLGDASLEIKGSTVYIMQDDDDVTLKITRSGELFINGQQVETSKKGKRLLKDFNHQMRELIESAEHLGYEAGKIGVEGAHIATSAVSGLMEVLFTDLTIDDLEEELENEAEKIEAKAKKLEKKAQKIERKADELEELQAELKKQIAELDKLEWF
ncbi:MAG: hypothetical protein JSW33_13055 [bacterium]|nr:MAG: hypothetical protein JSW33_13055 [bacterium]